MSVCITILLLCVAFSYAAVVDTSLRMIYKLRIREFSVQEDGVFLRSKLRISHNDSPGIPNCRRFYE